MGGSLFRGCSIAGIPASPHTWVIYMDEDAAIRARIEATLAIFFESLAQADEDIGSGPEDLLIGDRRLDQQAPTPAVEYVEVARSPQAITQYPGIPL